MTESLQKFHHHHHHYYGDKVRVSLPTGSDTASTLQEVASDLSRRLTRLFLRNESSRRPTTGDNDTFQTDPHWRDLVPFHEYFHGATGAGLGASHQTGWTALVAKLIQQCGSE